VNWRTHCGVVIPCLNEERFIETLVRDVRTYLSTVLVVDDGSTDSTSGRATAAGAVTLRHSERQGKGAALQTGIDWLDAHGFGWALLMDGDGQHAPSDIPKFLAAAEHGPAGLIIGDRMSNSQGMPPLRRWTNQWMSRRLSRRAGCPLPDSQCGFRLLPTALWNELNLRSRHFEIESEMLTAVVAAGRPVRFVAVETRYGSERTKISPFIDSIRWLRWLWNSRHIAPNRPATAPFQNLLQSPPPSSKLAL
jgi:glycosyltransferase involved in cell wall biosynthesis